MIKIEGSVTRTDLCLRQPIEPLTSGCKNCAFLQLRFSRFWQAYTERWVEFRLRSGEQLRAPVSRAGICVLPEEALAESGRIYLSVVGCQSGKNGEEGSRVVTELVPLLVTRGGYCEAREVG